MERVSKYTNLYRLEPYEERVDQLTQFFSQNAQNSFYIKTGEAQLDAQIEELQEKEKIILGLIEGVNTPEELEKHFNNIENKVVNFSGPEMYKQFILPLESENIKDFDAFQEGVTELVTKWAKEAGIEKILEPAVQEEISNIIFSKLNEGHKGWSFRKKETTSYNNFMDLILGTSARRVRMEELLEKNGIKYRMSSTDNSITIDTWFDITDRATQTQGKDYSPKKKLDDSRRIWNLISSKAGGADISLLKKCYVHILKESHLTEFYIGKNEKEVTGFLGELSALYYLCLLFNTTPNNLLGSAQVLWKGGKIDPSTNKKYHQDIFLKIAHSELGVQVKNSAKDLLGGSEMDVGFWKVNLPQFLDRLRILGLSEETTNLVESYFRTYQFNVPYGRKDGVFVQEINEQNSSFVSKREELVAANRDVDILLSVFAASYMYMDIADGLKSQHDRNILYLFGGVSLKTASQLLKKVRKELKTKNNPIYISSNLTKGGYNIVSSLNNDASRLSKQHKEETSGQGANDIKISAKYRFNLMSFLQ